MLSTPAPWHRYLLNGDDAILDAPYNSGSVATARKKAQRLISTTNLAACVCVSSKFDKFLPVRFYFVSKRPENFVRKAKFPYAAFGPLFAFHCPLFVTKNNNLGWNRHASPHTGTCRCNDHGPTVLSARGQ